MTLTWNGTEWTATVTLTCNEARVLAHIDTLPLPKETP